MYDVIIVGTPRRELQKSNIYLYVENTLPTLTLLYIT
jgi:hypothetical protein